ncbi:MATE family efflux transporter [Chondromyces apiculatus]|uniref:MATE family efflux transporter n=1 Tax=Chondromyces apiculatus DSM 436 TaxID=1192034 RepID=A0A017SVJ7_9BACT|nr:MATE family efflux transporter [Chondromyces apiculatus]EYF01003.1 Hypothetical protein CAP_8790 [Chondromyces apiculatus DSM 436]
MSLRARCTDRDFLRRLVGLAAPISIQQLVTSSLFHLVNAILLSHLGEAALGAVSLVGRMGGIASLVLGGIAGGVSMFCAQLGARSDRGDRGNHSARGDRDDIARVLGAGLLVTSAFTLPLALAAALAPGAVLHLLSSDPGVIEAGSAYLPLLALQYPLLAVILVFSAAARSLGRPRLPLVTAGIGAAVSTLLSYGLVLGRLGLPALGVHGAGVAALLSRLLEAALLVGALYLGPRTTPRAVPLPALPFRDGTLSRFLAPTWPLVLNELLWALGTFAYVAIYARMGTGPLAAIGVLTPIQWVCIDVFVGLGSAAGILLGQELGAGNEARAYDLAVRISIVGPAFAALGGVVIAFASGLLLAPFSGVGPAALGGARTMLFMFAATLWIQVSTMISCLGVMRAGGDTRFMLLFNTGGTWLLGLPLACAAFALGLPIEAVFACTLVEEFLKMLLWTHRLRSRRWMRDLGAAPLPSRP